MNKLLYLSIIVMFPVLFGACEKEEDLTPSSTDENYYLPDEDATDEISVARRAFYKESGVYLLFSDTLRVEDQDTIKLDLNYDYSPNYSYKTYTVAPYTNVSKANEALESFKSGVFAKLPTKFYPYSFLLCDSIMVNSSNDTVKTSYVTIPQCIAIAMGDVVKLSESDQEEFSIDLVSKLMSSKIISSYSDEMTDFFAVSDTYYENWFYWPDSYDMVNNYALGFLGYEEIWTLWNKSDDLYYYLKYMYSISEEEFRSTYGDYELVINKMELLNTALNEIGVVIYE